MPLLHGDLSLWEIGFRWAGYDPDSLRLRIPLPVRDNFRTLMDAVLNGHLYCSTLHLEKYDPRTSDSPELFIRHYIDEVYECIWGRKFDKKLLTWAQIERWSMKQWCERRGIPLPEFWFPRGWQIDYELPEEEWSESNSEGEPVVAETPATAPIPDTQASEPNSQTESTAASGEPPKMDVQPLAPPQTDGKSTGARKLDRRQRARIVCQEIAARLWSKESDAKSSIKVMASRSEIQDIGGGTDYDFDVVKRWLSEVDPRGPTEKRGPKKKNN